MTEQQPMKMAAAEAIYETGENVGFSLFSLGTLDGSEETFRLRDPGPRVLPGHRLVQR